MNPPTIENQKPEYSGWKIGRLFGIGIYVHWSFLGLLGFLLLNDWHAGVALEKSLHYIGFILMVFGCVVLHELGHGLTARLFNIKTEEIVLYPIGGIARLENSAYKAGAEFFIAIAGPMVNVILALGLLALHSARFSIDGQTSLVGPSMVENLMRVNVLLATFNMLPAFPMDGGRVLRALLALKLHYITATRIATRLGQATALVFALYAIFGTFNPMLLLVAFLIYFGADEEYRQAPGRALFKGIPVKKVMKTSFPFLSPQDPIDNAMDLLIDESLDAYPVMEGNRIIGMLSSFQLESVLDQFDREITVGEIMRKDIPILREEDPLDYAFQCMKDFQFPSFPVLRDDALVGILTVDKIRQEVVNHQRARLDRPNT